MRKLKVVLINTLVFGLLLIFVELIFGGWLNKENNLNSLLVIRNKVLKVDLNDLYPNTKEVITIKMDKFGFRGTARTYDKPENIDILCVGGSTTFQRYIEDGYTWPEVLENRLKENGLDYNIANAGIDGQSTVGHIRNFEVWFPQVPNLHPKYILFYVGLNDFHILKGKTGSDETKVKGLDFIKREIRENSVIYNSYRNVQGAILAERFNHNHSKVEFSTYDYGLNHLVERGDYPAFFNDRLEAYEQRLEYLVNLSAAMGATPVFITQPSRRFKFNAEHQVIGIQGAFDREFSGYKINGMDYFHLLVEMNKVIGKVAAKNDLAVIDQTHLGIWKDEDFYDFIHTTPSGSKKVGEHIASRLIPILDGK